MPVRSPPDGTALPAWAHRPQLNRVRQMAGHHPMRQVWLPCSGCPGNFLPDHTTPRLLQQQQQLQPRVSLMPISACRTSVGGPSSRAPEIIQFMLEEDVLDLEPEGGPLDDILVMPAQMGDLPGQRVLLRILEHRDLVPDAF
ncbi:hypothetical protein WJX84_008495 [Apatococcus fuscideae]|uniref:Uncharacterized protein n=1 Tax=Apatococcus fuscideae TaxID=2026836 RepID=A0AAW1SQX7_9CHLO